MKFGAKVIHHPHKDLFLCIFAVWRCKTFCFAIIQLIINLNKLAKKVLTQRTAPPGTPLKNKAWRKLFFHKSFSAKAVPGPESA